jgi:glycosyltransferase involved in cell wall biosynthesis
MKDRPLISIITVVYNDKVWLERTVKSVIKQTYSDIEFIVIDGGSTDGTLDVIRKYEDSINYWASEKDDGLYDAMNKGIFQASGDFVNFLMAGDTIKEKDSLENVSKQLTDFSKSYFSRAIILSDIGEWAYPPRSMCNEQEWLKYNLPNFQTMFISREIYNSNSFDLRLKLTADDDYKLIVIQHGLLHFIDVEFVEFRRDGVSSNHKSPSLFIQRVKESVVINLKHRRYIRLFLDPVKRLITFVVHLFFGDQIFLKFIKKIKNM